MCVCKRIRAKKHGVGIGMTFKVFSLRKNQAAWSFFPYTIRAHLKRDVVTCRNDQINMKVLKYCRASLVQERWQVFPVKECHSFMAFCRGIWLGTKDEPAPDTSWSGHQKHGIKKWDCVDLG